MTQSDRVGNKHRQQEKHCSSAICYILEENNSILVVFIFLNLYNSTLVVLQMQDC